MDTSANVATPSSPLTYSKPLKESYKQATGRFKLLCTFDAVFVNNDKEINLKTAKILKTLVSNARSKRNTKFQMIRLDNPKIQQYIVQNEAAIDLLKLIGFEEACDDDNNHHSEFSLRYNPLTTTQLQEGSKLESLLDDKIEKLQKVDLSSPAVKQNKSKAKTKKLEAVESRKQQIAMFQEDRERQKEREEREQRIKETVHVDLTESV